MMERNGTHIKTQGRESKLSVNGNWEKGIESIHQTAKNTKTRTGASQDNDGNAQLEEETGENEVDLDEEDLILDDE